MTKLNEQSDRDHLGRAPELIALIASGSMSQTACVAAELRIPDLLANEAKHVDELARATGSHAGSLHRLLRVLVALDLCIEREDGAFALSPMGQTIAEEEEIPP